MKFIQKQPLEVFYKKGIRKNFAKFTGKQLRLSLKRPWHRCFLVNFGKILRTPSYEKPLGNCFCPFRGTKDSKHYSHSSLFSKDKKGQQLSFHL